MDLHPCRQGPAAADDDDGPLPPFRTPFSERRMSPSLADLRAFVTVAQLRSFAVAAHTLHLSQPALSRRIAKLEEVLGVRLLDRTSRTVAPTSVGRAFLRQVRDVVDQLDRSLLGVRDLVDVSAGTVRVGCMASAAQHFLPAVVRTFRLRFPKVAVDILDDGADQVLDQVRNGDVDFGLDHADDEAPSLEFTPLVSDPLVLACRSDHPLARRPILTWPELARPDLIRVSSASRQREGMDPALAHLPALPLPACEVQHVSTAVRLVEAGLGVAVVPRIALPVQPSPVVGVPMASPSNTRTLGVVRRRGHSLSPAASIFLELLLSQREDALISAA